MAVVLSAFVTSTDLGGAASEPSRRPVACVPRSAGITCAFQRRKFPLVSFSVGGAPRLRPTLLEPAMAIGFLAIAGFSGFCIDRCGDR